MSNDTKQPGKGAIKAATAISGMRYRGKLDNATIDEIARLIEPHMGHAELVAALKGLLSAQAHAEKMHITSVGLRVEDADNALMDAISNAHQALANQ